ncbi:hypothetical protein GW17_00033481, partial [Ensete ventricosum]
IAAGSVVQREIAAGRERLLLAALCSKRSLLATLCSEGSLLATTKSLLAARDRCWLRPNRCWLEEIAAGCERSLLAVRDRCWQRCAATDRC